MNEVVSLTSKLISFASVTPKDEGCQALIAERLTRIGFNCEQFPFGDVCNLWARYGTTEPLLVFAGHTDVVPSGPETLWQSPPFEATVRENKLYGRGAVDMKGAISAMIIAVEKYLQTNPQFSGSIAFLITSDEEGPALDGTKKVIEILQQRNEKITYCIIGEPSSDQVIGDQIRIGRRGSLHGTLKIHGKQGHVAHPHLALNPIHLSVHALHELAHTIWDEGNEDFPATSFQITNIESGTGVRNVIPDFLKTLFNFRHSTVFSVAELQQKTTDILNQYPFKYNLDWEIGAIPFLTKKGKLIEVTRAAIQKINGIKTRLSTGGGTSDGRFIANTGAEIVELGLLHASAHHINEFVSLQDLENLSQIYQEIIKTLLPS